MLKEEEEEEDILENKNQLDVGMKRERSRSPPPSSRSSPPPQSSEKKLKKEVSLPQLDEKEEKEQVLTEELATATTNAFNVFSRIPETLQKMILGKISIIALIKFLNNLAQVLSNPNVLRAVIVEWIQREFKISSNGLANAIVESYFRKFPEETKILTTEQIMLIIKNLRKDLLEEFEDEEGKEVKKKIKIKNRVVRHGKFVSKLFSEQKTYDIGLQFMQDYAHTGLVPKIAYENEDELIITTIFIEDYIPLEKFLQSRKKEEPKLDGHKFLINILEALYKLNHQRDYVDLHANLNNIGFKEEDYSFVFYEGGDKIIPVESFQEVVREFTQGRFNLLNNPWFQRKVDKITKYLPTVENFLFKKKEPRDIFSASRIERKMLSETHKKKSDGDGGGGGGITFMGKEVEERINNNNEIKYKQIMVINLHNNNKKCKLLRLK